MDETSKQPTEDPHLPVEGATPAIQSTGTAGTRQWHGNPRVLWAAVAVLVVLVGVLGAALVVLGSKPGTFTLRGTFSLPRIHVASFGTNGCRGFRDESDISSGATVTVYDSTGQVVALGALGQGTLSGLACEFPFEVDAPSGSNSYTVEVARRGKLTFGAAEVENGPVALTLR